jgi:hypothetical protein
MSRRPALFLACLFTVLGIAACDDKPTFTRDQVTGAIQQFMKEDGVDASAHLVDHTLGVQMSYAGSLRQTGAQLELGDEFEEAVRKALTTIHRVLLSTDAEVEFYVLLLSDPDAPGAYLTMVRYMDDIRRANASMLDPAEMFARTIFELNYVGAAPVTIEQYVPREIRLEDFLSWQLARRIQATLTEELRPLGIANVGRCGGRFQGREFVFTLDVTPATEGPLDEPMLHHVFEASTDVIAKVLSSYRFESYDSIRLVHPLTGRNLVLPKTHLDVFR